MRRRLRHAHTVTRVRRTGLDKMGRRHEKSSPLVFRAGFAPTVNRTEDTGTESPQPGGTFYTPSVQVDVQPGDLITSPGSWRVTEVLRWESPITERVWGLEIRVEASSEVQA